MNMAKNTYLKLLLKVVALLSLVAFCSTQPTCPTDNPASTQQQVIIENQARAIYSQPQYQAAKVVAGASVQAQVNPPKDATNELLFPSFLDQLAYFGATLTATISSPGTPVLQLEIPSHIRNNTIYLGAKQNYDNPDTIYRNFFISFLNSYTIVGKQVKDAPVDFTLQVLDFQQQNAGFLAKENITFGADGSFTITIDNQPANGKPNHIQVQATAFQVLIRDTFSDWNNQRPYLLTVTGTGPVQNVLQGIPQQVIQGLSGPAFLQLVANVSAGFSKQALSKPVNTLEQPNSNPGVGLSPNIKRAIGWFQLKDQQAFVVTISLGGAKYFGLPVTDYWTISGDYLRTTNSLNIGQSKPNNNGTYTLVISNCDPGVYNWVNTDGLDSGTLLLRLQAFDPKYKGPAASTSTFVVDLANLKSALPPETVYVAPAERAQQTTDRYNSIKWRECGVGAITDQAF